MTIVREPAAARTIAVTAPAGGLLLVKALVVVAMFSGFINLIPAGEFMPATFLIDSIVAAMALLAFIALCRGASLEFWMIALILLLVASVVLMLQGPEAVGPQFRAVRNQVFYAFAGLYTAVAVRDRDGAMSIMTLVMRLGLVLAAFGCVQFFFRDILPEWLLFSRDTILFSYYGTDISRSTGLVGNSIIFATLLVLIYSLWLAQALWRPRVMTFANAALMAAGIVTTFSRASILCAALISFCMLAAVLWRIRPSRRIPLLASLSLAGALLAIGFIGNESWRDTLTGSFIWKGLFLGENATAAGSNKRHYQYATFAIESFSRHPVFGIGLGTQSQYSENAMSSVVITDGFHYSTLVEGGLFLFLPTLLFLLAVIFRAVRAYHSFPLSFKHIPFAIAIYFFSQVAIAGFINTGFYGKVANLIGWIVFGAMVALARANTAEGALTQALKRDVCRTRYCST
ncbi:hypothetical protein GGC64_002001 [Mycobacterium sp. OAS707]|uniref:O-antigen ligase family protein n=1 Tax=Mycobacterium sp. OAS707 TaxID=2663822 RepID=UPI00178A7FA7|nr:O-antigen ligase family protein [Mycobacterium sp. OAS707]MBE1547993.1 hypothetical protein [Mycobacterium sp. OAS707]